MTDLSTIESLQKSAAQAANAYEWEEVRDLLTEALENEDIPPELEIELRMARAESYSYLANTYKQRDDLEAALHLAQKISQIHLLAEPMIRLSTVISQIDGPREGLRLAREALTLVEKLNDHRLLSECMQRMCQFYFALDDIDSLQTTMDRFEKHLDEHENPSGRAWSLLGKANLINRKYGDEDAARGAALESVHLFRRIGDFRGELTANNILGNVTSDLGLSRSSYERGLDIANLIRDRENQRTFYNNLAFVYFRLGLYNEALSLSQQAVKLVYRSAEHHRAVIPLATLAESYLGIGDYEAAAREAEASQRLASEQGMPQWAGPYPELLFGLGRLKAGDAQTARIHLQNAADGFGELSNPGWQATSLAWLAAAELELGEIEAALEHTELATSNPDFVTLYPVQELWWWRYRSLARAAEASGEQPGEEAWHALEQARDLMLRGISNLSDPGLRRNYQNKVAVNREIAEEWSKEAARRGVDLERFAKPDHPTAELHEQLRRLVDLGGRLTAQRDPELLPEFILNQFVELSGAERAFIAANTHFEEGDWNWEASFGIPYDQADDFRTTVSDKVGEETNERHPAIYETLGDEPNADASPLFERSAIVLPLVSQGKMQGVLYGDMRHLFGIFEQRDLELLSLLANQAAAALENAQWSANLEAQVAERTAELSAANAELEVINSVQRGLASRLEFQAIIDLVGETVREIFASENLAISLYDKDSDTISFAYFLEHGDRFHVEPAKLETGFNAHVIRSKQPLLITQDLEKWMEKLGFRAIGDADSPLSQQYLGVPIMSGEDPIGVIALGSMDKSPLFNEADVSLISTLANSMSVALENARLFDETNRLLDETRQRNAELEVINTVQRGLASRLEFQAIIDLVGDTLSEIISSQNMSIALHDKESDMISFPYFQEHGERFSVEPAPLGPGFSSHIIKTKEPLLITHDIDKKREELGSYKIGDLDAPFPNQYLGVPIMRGEEAIGVVFMTSIDTKELFDDSYLSLVTTLANSMSVALENARLFDETNRLLDETRQRNAELTVINSASTALAKQLDYQSIIDLLGERIQEIFQADTVFIVTYDKKTNMLLAPYFVERGFRHDPPPVKLGDPSSGLVSLIVKERRVLNLGTFEQSSALGAYAMPSPGTAEDLNESYLGVPILVGDEVTGAVSVQSYKQYAYDEGDVRLLSTLATNTGVALENARLFDETTRLLAETEQRNSELAVINSVQQGLAAELDMQAIYDLVGDQIRDIFDAQMASIGVYDRDKELVKSLYLIEKGKRYYPEPIPFNNLHRHLIESGEPVLINENVGDAKAEFGMHTLPGTETAKSMLFVPLKVSEGVIGAVSLQNIDRENAFSSSDVRLLRTLANSMSVALENARLFDETTRLLAETEQRNSELAVINSVQQGLAAELDMQAIYDLVGDQIRDIFDAQVVLINSFDHANQTVIANYAIEKGERLYLQSGPWSDFNRHLIQHKEVVLINENADDIGSEYGLQLVPGTEEPKSLLFVPLMIGETVKGFFSLQNIDHENAFSDSDVRLLTTLAGSMSVALENARLFDETNRLLAETEQRNTELAVINSVQQGLAAELDMQAIYDLVGDQIRDIFDAQVVLINSLDYESEQSTTNYLIEKGERHYLGPRPFSDFERQFIENPEVVLINENADEVSDKYGLKLAPGTELSKSMLFTPLIIGDRVRGYFSLQNIDHEHAFSDSDVRLLTTLAGSMSVALENARLFDETNRLLAETERRVNELTTVNRISQALASELELDALIELVGEQTCNTFNADIAYVALYDPQSNVINFPYQYGDEIAPIQFGEGLTSQVIQSGEPLLINEDIDARYEEFETARIGARALSYLGVPIIAGRQPIGVISVQSTSKEGRFGEDDVRLLNTIAANVGAAIQNARLFQESQRRAEEMATLAEIGSDIAAIRELEPVLERMTQRVMELMHVGDIALYLPEPDGKAFRAHIVLGKFVEEIKASPIVLDHGIIGSVLKNGVAEYVNYSYDDPRARHIPGTPPPEEVQEALMAAPLLSRGEVIGGIAMWRPHEDGLFTDSDLDFLVSVARQAAIAIESARLYVETQNRAEEMAALAAVGRDISETLEQEAVLERIATHAKDLLAADTSAVYLPDPGDQTLRAIVALGEIADEIKADTIQAGQGIIGDLYSRGAAEVINDTLADPRARRIPGTAEIPDERLLVAPLLSGDKISGMMAVWRSGPGEQFTGEHLRFLQGLAQQAAIAIENAKLFAEIRRQKQYFEALVQSSPAAILTIDMEGKGETWNPAAERLFGYSEEEAVGQSVDSLVASADSVHGEALDFNRLVAKGESVRAITQRTRKDGKLVDVELFAQPVVVDKQQVGTIAIYHDITEILQARREAEEAQIEAEIAREDAERANAAKSTFLANMSHELRTPLNAIIGFTRIVQRKAKDTLPQKQIDNLDKVLVSAEHLLGLINTILDISKIEAGRMDVQPSIFEMGNLIDVCATTAQPLLKTGVRLQTSIKNGLPPVYSDQDKVKQILLNLLSNAAKFTPEGTISIMASRQKEMLKVVVSDTGIGISAEDLERVFEEFQQADSGTTRQYGGTGLGLPISRQLARLLGGELIADSEVGKGSTFTLTIPLRYEEEIAAIEEAVPPRTTPKHAGLRREDVSLDRPVILAIDDDPDVIYLLREDLGDAGFQVVGAMSGEEGLRKAIDLQPLAITLDIMMPQKDGWQVLHELKTHPQTREIPVIMLSIVDKKALGYQLGAADYLVKPLESDQVLTALRRLTVVNGNQEPRRLLVVDDDPNVVDMTRQLLEDEPVEIEAAADGLEALDRIRMQQPDAILLDLMMPGLDGFGVLERLSQDPDLREIPVIVLTAKTLTAAEIELLQSSVSQVILKQGLEAETLLQEVHKALA